VRLLLSATLADGNKLMKIEGFQGRNVSFKCSHRLAWTYNKYFCKDPCGSEKDRLATVKSGGRTESGRITLTKGRFSMYDNTTGSFFIVKVDKLRLNDSGTYQCGVDISLQPDYHSAIKLNVSQGIV
uniref:Immunoglobulin V-set domain-containing protein n=1 Tax=Astatotilapia calliptera TaxID=8154 RepID=A0A3P8R3T3_ASTCA